jgi:FeS assembly protein IscX
MATKMNWSDTLDIAIALHEKYPDQDPLAVRFTDLHKWVRELPGFEGDPNKSNEKILEAIQMAWVDEREG